MPAGRPPKYKTPKEMQRIIDLYFLACKENKTGEAEKGVIAELYIKLNKADLKVAQSIEDYIPTVSGLAYTLGMSTEAFRNYEQKDKFLATVKRAKQRIEISLEQRLAGNNVTGSIFNLKNNFGWKDKVEQEISGPGGGAQEHKWTIDVVSPDDSKE